MKQRKIKLIVSELFRYNKSLKDLNTDVAKKNHMAAELSRFTHSIEKGLTISDPRLGFGHDKQRKIMELIIQLENSSSTYHREVCLVALDALKEYLEYHNKRGYIDEFCNELSEFVNSHQIDHEGKLGGVKQISKNDCKFDVDYLERFFRNRHSVRDFDDSDIDDELLKKAIILAKCAPSACNRQGVRAYVLSRELSNSLSKELSGVGGFADKAARIIMITAKTSSYRQEEMYQYIVSASIFAAYLSLTLHTYGVGACIVQRQVVWSKDWNNLRNSLCIPGDEQLCLLLAVGNLKEDFLVPVSYRLQNEEMFRFIK